MKALDLNQLEELIRRYPWYSLARREYFLRMLEMGPEYAEEALAKVALYLPSRLPLFRALQAQSQQDPAPLPWTPASPCRKQLRTNRRLWLSEEITSQGRILKPCPRPRKRRRPNR